MHTRAPRSNNDGTLYFCFGHMQTMRNAARSGVDTVRRTAALSLAPVVVRLILRQAVWSAASMHAFWLF